MRTKGFTLIEVLVTLMITAMFSSAVYSIFLGNVKSSKEAEKAIRLSRLSHSIIRLFRKDFTACLPGLEGAAPLVGSVQGDGSSRCELITAVDASTPQDGLVSDTVRAVYFLMPNQEKEGLHLLYRSEDFGSGRSFEEDRARLISDEIAEFKLEYLDGETWATAWNNPAPPRAVRVTLAFNKGQLLTSVFPIPTGGGV